MELIVARGHEEHQVEVRATEGSVWTIAVDDREYRIDVAELGRPEVLSLITGGRQATMHVQPLGAGVYRVAGEELEVIDPRSQAPREGTRQGGGDRFEAKAWMPGRVTAVLAAEGDEVTAGQGVVVLEAMKMENEIPSEIDGRVEQLLVEVDQTVNAGDPLFAVGAIAGPD